MQWRIILSKNYPVHRDIEQLKKQAKELLQSANSGNPSALQEFNALGLKPPKVNQFQLTQAQLVIARREGFKSWQQLRDSIEEQAAQAFFDAIREGNIRRMKKLGREFPDVLNHHEKSTQMLPIQLAAYEGQLEVVKLLLAVGANPTQGNRPVRMQSHALYYAEERGHVGVVDCIRKWLAKHRRHTKEAQQLCEAIRADDFALVERLLERDHSLANATEFGNASGNPGGDSILHFAILNDRPECVELLITHGAELSGRSPLQRALSFLVGLAHRPGLDKELELGKRMQIVEILLKAGVKRDLWVECCLGNLSEVRAIVEANPDAVNRSVNPSHASGGVGMDHYPLTGAVGAQQLEIAKYLLENGADPNTPFRLKDYSHLDHGAPMELAVRNGNVELVNLLLDYGASPNTSRHACSNAVQTAIDFGNDQLLQLLLDNGGVIGFDAQLKIDWSNGQNASLREAFLDTDAPVPIDLVARFIRSSVFSGLPRILERALSKLDFIPSEVQFELFQSLIEMWSLYVGNVKGVKADDYFECMKLLLDFGVDPNAVNDQGETCLHRLASDSSFPKEEHRLEFAKLLLIRGADPNRMDRIIPMTPLDLAKRNGFSLLEVLMTKAT